MFLTLLLMKLINSNWKLMSFNILIKYNMANVMLKFW